MYTIDSHAAFSLCSSSVSPFRLLPKLLMAVVDVVAEYKLCLNNQVVPVEKRLCSFLDPYDLASQINVDIEQDLELTLVQFKTRTDLGWLDRALQVLSRTCSQYLLDLPLIQEIKNLIEQKKQANRQGQKARESTSWKAFVILQVRDRILVCQNTTHSVVLALLGPDGDPASLAGQMRTLEWFAQEFAEDLQKLQSNTSSRDTPNQVPQEEPAQQAVAAKALVQVLLQHPGCSKAFWQPSRLGFKVLKTGTQKLREFRVQGLNKRKQGASPPDPSEAFEQTKSKIFEYLEQPVLEDSQAGAADQEDL